MKKLNFELVKRFTRDEKLPIQEIRDEGYFYHMIKLLENSHAAETKWNNWMKVVDTQYNGDPNAYLTEFHNLRDKIINDMKADPKYIDFNNCDMNKYHIVDMPQVGSREVYRACNRGKIYLSIDLKKANYQALNFAGVIEEPSYVQWLSKWTQLQHLLDSKYLRVVVFGQLNPGRHITVEKYMTSLLYHQVCDILPMAELVSFRQDELIWEAPAEVLDLVDEIKKKSWFDISVDVYKLHCFELIQEISGRKVEFCKKEYLDGSPSTYHCIPGVYQALVNCLLNGIEPGYYDTLVLGSDGLWCNFIGNFTLKEIEI